MNDKTLYIYYLIHTPKSSLVPTIYAFSNDEEICREFESTRNMNSFYRKVVKFNSKHERMIAEQKIGKDYLLVRTKFKTRDMTQDTDTQHVSIVVTCGEELSIQRTEEYFLHEGSKCTTEMIYLLQKEYLQLLDALYYFHFMSYNEVKTTHCLDYMSDGLMLKRYTMPPIDNDEYQTFMYFYGRLMKQ